MLSYQEIKEGLFKEKKTANVADLKVIEKIFKINKLPDFSLSSKDLKPIRDAIEILGDKEFAPRFKIDDFLSNIEEVARIWKSKADQMKPFIKDLKRLQKRAGE